MGLQSLSDWLLSNHDFQERLTRLTVRSAAESIGGGLVPHDAVAKGELDWSYLLHCATILANSEKGSGQEAALRIAQYAITAKDSTAATRTAGAIILETMANRPALNLAIRRSQLPKDYINSAPIPARIDSVRNKFDSMLLRNDSVTFSANRFQKRVWAALKNSDWVSLSAPTSAGKSFILIEWIGEHVRENVSALVVYVVPTRALISQVFTDLRDYFSEQKLSEAVNVSAFPDAKEIRQGSNVFVFTQERLHLFLLSIGGPKNITALIIDEAHKVGDRYRGVLLQQMIEWVSKTSWKTKFVFSSPFAINPEYLLTEAPSQAKTDAFVAEVATVNQNLLWIGQANRKPKKWNVQLCRNEQLFDVGTIELRHKPDTKRKKLAFIAAAIANNEAGNIVYVNGADEAEEVADLIYQISLDRAPSDEINSLIDICRKSVHAEFKLAKFLRRGVAFHYGNIPQIVRLEVESLFKADLIHTLVCTSTLIEGVNMSCKNIFIRGPQKGRGNPMPNEDFWNLAGRAGRWGKEFQGNIYCIDPTNEDAWGEASAPKARRPYAIQRTIDRILSDPAPFLKYLQDGAPKVNQKERELEYVFSYLSGLHLREGGVSKARWAARFPEDTIKRISNAITSASQEADIPAAIIDRNPGVSPLAMRALLDFFIENSNYLEDLIPIDPDSEGAVNNYAMIFEIMSNKLLATSLGGFEGRSMAVAILVHQWMKGLPIPVIIEKKIKYLTKNGKSFRISSLIRGILDEVESVARFHAPRYVACYSDILRLAMRKTGMESLEGDIVELGTYLEFGASQRTQLSLMALGLSRTAAIDISARIADDDLSEGGCIKFLQKLNLADERFSALVKREIEEVLKNRR